MSVCGACRHWGISRQAYYMQLQQERTRYVRDQQVLRQVVDWRRRQPRLGTRKLYHVMKPDLKRDGIKLGRDGLFGVLRRAHLLVAPKRAYHKTTDSHHRFRRHPNLLKTGPEQVTPSAPDQVWVADITYLPTRHAFVYISLVTDAWSRKIVGYHVHDSVHTCHVSKALLMALRQKAGSQPLIHHSDRGVQYCSSEYQQIHERHQIRCSMADGYDCYQNALAERVNGILKQELLLERPEDLAQAKRMVSESVAIYNRERSHMALQYKTPDEIHRAFRVSI